MKPKSYPEIEKDQAFKDYHIKQRSDQTKARSRLAIGSFLEFLATKHDQVFTPSELIEYFEIDDRKERKKRIRRMENYWQGYISWLQSEYHNAQSKKGKPVSENTVKAYASEIKTFLGDSDIELKRATFPQSLKGMVGRQNNEKMSIRKPEMRKLVNALSSNIYKAMLLVQYQSGMDSQTLVNLKYGDVKRGLENGDCPIMLKLKRQKTNTPFKTFIGYDAIDFINAFLKERRLPRSVCRAHKRKYSWVAKINKCPKCGGAMSREIPEIKDSDYLFTGFRGGNPNSTQTHYRVKIREAAVSCGLVTTEELEVADFSPIRSHGLRASFSSIMTNSGMPEAMVNFMMGHSDRYGGAYLKMTDEELTEMYSAHMMAVSISEESDMTSFETELADLRKTVVGQQLMIQEMADVSNTLRSSDGKILDLLLDRMVQKAPELVDDPVLLEIRDVRSRNKVWDDFIKDEGARVYNREGEGKELSREDFDEFVKKQFNAYLRKRKS